MLGATRTPELCDLLGNKRVFLGGVVSFTVASVACGLAPSAELLVVGRRGHGGFKGLLMGSTSSACVAHAPCPVLVLPDETVDAGRAEDSGQAQGAGPAG